MQIMIIKSVLCVVMLLAMLLHYIGPKRTRASLEHCGLSH